MSVRIGRNDGDNNKKFMQLCHAFLCVSCERFALPKLPQSLFLHMTLKGTGGLPGVSLETPAFGRFFFAPKCIRIYIKSVFDRKRFELKINLFSV